MVKGAGAATGPGVYSATYSNIPVWEFQFGDDLKEHVMRRRYDDYINATHILKAAGFDKPARTRILEREVQKGEHEKVQGGYGKYQGTWVPLEKGAELARRNNIYDKLATIFEFVNGDSSPPPAPKHTTSKPKAKKPAVPKFPNPKPAVPRMLDEDMYDNMSVQYQETETPDDNMTVASLMDDDYNFSAPPSQRKRKRSPSGPLPLPADQQAHLLYADSLLDYFMLSTSEAASRPEPPPNFNPNWTIDTEGHTALHWAAAMGDLDVMRQLRAFGADIEARNLRDETPLMRAVLFTNCFDRLSMPRVVGDLISTVGCADKSGCTAIHHAANLTQSRTKHHCARYYLDVILNKMSETMEQEEIQRILNLQDNNGFTACHIAARNRARKCLRALMGRGAVTDIPDNSGIRVEQLIPELNATRRPTAPVQSSSPFAPDTVDRSNFYAEPTGAGGAGLSGRDGGEAGRPQMNLAQALSQARQQPHHSEAAQTVSSKITPLVISKFQDLARSFDEELREREADEKESRRILAQSAKELAEVQRATTELGVVEDDSAGARNEQNQLQHAKTRVISLVEQGQSILISASVADKGNQMNGLPNGDSESGQDPEELIKLLEELREEQTKRQKLVQDYASALADRGVGEKADVYRRLTAKCLGMREQEVDGQLDELLRCLEEDGEGGGGS